MSQNPRSALLQGPRWLTEWSLHLQEPSPFRMLLNLRSSAPPDNNSASFNTKKSKSKNNKKLKEEESDEE